MVGEVDSDNVVSVIVPIYNVQDYIGRCIESIQKQLFKNLEILLINDGSSDNSRQICLEYADKDNRIKIIDKENGGLSDARNIGIKVAKGDYIVFVDGDDFVKEDYVSLLYEKIILTGAEVSICSFDIVDDDGKLIKRETVSELHSLVTGKMILDHVLTSYGYKYVVAWNKMYSAKFLKKNMFDVGKLYEDEYFNFRFFLNLNRVAIVPQPLYCYVQRPGSITQSAMSMEKIRMKEEMHKCRIEFYKTHSEMYLYTKSCQMYCNWLVECVLQYSKILQPKERKRYQTEMRIYSRIADHAKHLSLALRIQNWIGRISLTLAGTVKKIYKGEKNVQEKYVR